MGVSRVDFGGETLIDLTSDTVMPEALFSGYKAHNRAGEQIVGTAESVLQWQNTSNGTYAFVQSGDRWIANNRGINSSTATSTWEVTVPTATTAYIAWRTATESVDKLSITLNGTSVLSATGGLKSSETVLTLNLVAGENTLVATYTKDGSVHSYGDMAYVVLPPIGGQPGQYKYQSKSVTPSASAQTLYPDSGYDGLYSVSVGAVTTDKGINYNFGTVSVPSSGNTVSINVGFDPRMFCFMTYTSRQDNVVYLKDWDTTHVLVAEKNGDALGGYYQTIGSSTCKLQSVGSTVVIKSTTKIQNKTGFWMAVK